MATLTAKAGQTDFQASATYYEAAAPSTNDIILINEGSQDFTNLSGLPSGLTIVVGPNFNGSLDGLSAIAQLNMVGGIGSYVRVSGAVSGYVTKFGAGQLVVDGSALPNLYAFNTSKIHILEACDLSNAFLINASECIIESHASAIIDILRMEGGSAVLRRNLDLGLMAGPSRLRMENCAVSDGGGTALLEMIDPRCVLEIVNRAATTHDEVRGYAGSVSVAESTGVQTFSKMTQTPLLNFNNRNFKGDAAVVSTPTVLGAAGLASYMAGKSKP